MRTAIAPTPVLPTGTLVCRLVCITLNARSMTPDDAVEWTQPDGDITWDSNDPFGGLTIPSDLFNVLRVEGSVQTLNPYHTTRRHCIRS